MDCVVKRQTARAACKTSSVRLPPSPPPPPPTFAMPLRVLVGYGLTETSPVIANRVAKENTRGTTGKPSPGTEVKIIDLEDGRQVTTDN